MEPNELGLNEQVSDFVGSGIQKVLMDTQNQFGVSLTAEQMQKILNNLFDSLAKEKSHGQGSSVFDARTPEDKVLQNHLTLRLILHRLDVKSLKEARQVSKLWTGESSKFMFEIGFFKVPQLIEKKSRSEQKEILEMLKNLISTKNIKIEKLLLNKIEDIDIFDSLEIPSSQIRELKFPFDEAEKYQEVMRDKFTSLTTVTHKYTSTPFYNPRVLQVFNTIYKPVILSHLMFDHDDKLINGMSSSEMYSLAAEAEMEAKSIIIKLPERITYLGPWEDWADILKNSVDVVEEIIIENPLRSLAELNFPELPRVKKVVLLITIYLQYEDPDYVSRVFDESLLKNFNFSKIFPNLSTVEIAILAPNDGSYNKPFDLWGQCFDSVEPVSSVRKVIYKSFCNVDFDISPLRFTFPEAKFVIHRQ